MHEQAHGWGVKRSVSLWGGRFRGLFLAWVEVLEILLGGDVRQERDTIDLYVDPAKHETAGIAQLLYDRPLGAPARALTLRTGLDKPTPSVIDIVAAASPPQPLLGSFLVGVHHRAHAHSEETIRLGEVHHVEFDHSAADHSCRAESGRAGPVEVWQVKRHAQNIQHERRTTDGLAISLSTSVKQYTPSPGCSRRRAYDSTAIQRLSVVPGVRGEPGILSAG